MGTGINILSPRHPNWNKLKLTEFGFDENTFE